MQLSKATQSKAKHSITVQQTNTLWAGGMRSRQNSAAGKEEQAHLGTDNKAPYHATPDDEGLQHIEAIEGGNEGVLHFLVVLDGLVKVAPLQVFVAEVLDCLVVQQGVCGFGTLGIVKAIQVPTAALL